METWFLVLLPVGLLAIVSGLCFVGCAFNTHGLGPDFTSYSDQDVIPDCIAYWRLNDEGPQALDSKDSHHGTYFSVINQDESPTNPKYPTPSYPQGPFRSALATGKLTEGADGIVTGDFIGGPDGSQAGCMQTDGACVVIPLANAVATPANAFTAEAWISPEWDPSDNDAVHTFLDFRDVDPMSGAITGFAMWIDGQGQLNGGIGLGTPTLFQITGGGIELQVPVHVVLTLQNNAASLFVNGFNTALQPLPQSYVPNTTGRQAIGAGAPWAANRSDPNALTLFFPAFPFNGKIQDVAIYDHALSASTIATHHTNGLGKNSN